MAIRLRTVAGLRVALCAAETNALPGDVYVDDGDHHALSAKFAQDWQGRTVKWGPYPEWEAMATQKLCDAYEEFRKWEDAGRPDWSKPEST